MSWGCGGSKFPATSGPRNSSISIAASHYKHFSSQNNTFLCLLAIIWCPARRRGGSIIGGWEVDIPTHCTLTGHRWELVGGEATVPKHLSPLNFPPNCCPVNSTFCSVKTLSCQLGPYLSVNLITAMVWVKQNLLNCWLGTFKIHLVIFLYSIQIENLMPCMKGAASMAKDTMVECEKMAEQSKQFQECLVSLSVFITLHHNFLRGNFLLLGNKLGQQNL